MELYIKKVISGGQTGADIAGLKAARKTGIETGGYIPKGYLTEKGTNQYLKRFGLIQTLSKDYAERTELNIRYSDGTVIFSRTDKSGNVTGTGTLLTLKIARDYDKPFIINPSPDEFREWIIRNDIRTLNVAGNRESQNKGIKEKVYRFLVDNLIIDNRISIQRPKGFINFKKSIEELRNDNYSGSVTITNKLHNAVFEYVKYSEEDIDSLNRNIRSNLLYFKYGDAANMILFRNFTDSFLAIVNRKSSKKEYLKFLEEYRKKNETISLKIVKSALKEIEFRNKTVALFSNSTTVVSVFQMLAKQKTYPSILQCRSEPENEGLVQARALKKLGFRVKVIKDEDIVKYVKKADFLLLGCDVYNDEVFVNKKGTFFQVFKFNVNNKPVYVLSDSRKYSKENIKYLRIKDNTLFEQITLKRVTKVITD